MGDSYQEIMVKRNTPMSDQLKKYGLLALTVLVILAGILFIPVLLIAGIVLVVLCIWLFPRFDLEYEYLYVNGELDIDKIMGKQKRKRCASYNMENLEILAPSNSHALDSYKNNKEIRVRDFTSLDPNAASYTLVISQDKGREMVKAEINEAVVQEIRRMAPRKVVQY